ncbi:MAG: molybdopterin-dependent oxidoreductase [Nanoarchaeota archaeon]|nr:molybdopterin-dependent oxidoreductase [Nanoarchaeota archaeon]
MKYLALIFLVGIVLVSGCTQQPIKLDTVEITEYKGEKLSSVNDFRENSIKGPQYIDIENYMLEVTGLVDQPASLTYDDVLAHQSYEKVVTLYCVEGWDVTILWEGVLLKDLLETTGIKHEANTIIFHAYDDYTSSLPLDYIMDNNILLAYKMNGATIPPERGFPFQVVAEDKLGYKWVKWVTKIELANDPEYKGYWERRGYDNQADV